MNETLDLRHFNVGLYSNPDQQDIPDEAQTEGSYNLDSNLEGKLGGVYPSSLIHASYGMGGTKFGWIERNDGKWDLIYTNGTGLYAITDFYGTQALTTLSASHGANVIVPNNREVHIGRYGDELISAWVGYISHGQFRENAPTGLQMEEAEPAPPTAHSISALTQHTAADDEDAKFLKGNMYEYRLSLVYDGYQESPLGGTTADIQLTTFVDYITVL